MSRNRRSRSARLMRRRRPASSAVIAFKVICSIEQPLADELRVRAALIDLITPKGGTQITDEPVPSGHTQAAVVGYGILLLVLLPVIKPRHRPWEIAAAVAMVVLIGFSRIALGAHYLSDVVGAALIGSVWLWAMTAAFSEWRRDRGLAAVTAEQGLDRRRRTGSNRAHDRPTRLACQRARGGWTRRA